MYDVWRIAYTVKIRIGPVVVTPEVAARRIAIIPSIHWTKLTEREKEKGLVRIVQEVVMIEAIVASKIRPEFILIQLDANYIVCYSVANDNIARGILEPDASKVVYQSVANNTIVVGERIEPDADPAVYCFVANNTIIARGTPEHDAKVVVCHGVASDNIGRRIVESDALYFVCHVISNDAIVRGTSETEAIAIPFDLCVSHRHITPIVKQYSRTGTA